jgi:hypothetical protein
MQGTSGQLIFTVNLDIQFQLDTYKVERIRSQRVIAPKLLAKHSTGAYHLPNIMAEFVRLLALCAGEFDSFGIVLR